MTKASPEVEALAQQRLARDESEITGSRRTKVTLGRAWADFWKHPSPWIMLATICGCATPNAATVQQPMQPPIRCARPMPRWSSRPLPCAT